MSEAGRVFQLNEPSARTLRKSLSRSRCCPPSVASLLKATSPILSVSSSSVDSSRPVTCILPCRFPRSMSLKSASILPVMSHLCPSLPIGIAPNPLRFAWHCSERLPPCLLVCTCTRAIVFGSSSANPPLMVSPSMSALKGMLRCSYPLYVIWFSNPSTASLASPPVFGRVPLMLASLAFPGSVPSTLASNEAVVPLVFSERFIRCPIRMSVATICPSTSFMLSRVASTSTVPCSLSVVRFVRSSPP